MTSAARVRNTMAAPAIATRTTTNAATAIRQPRSPRDLVSSTTRRLPNRRRPQRPWLHLSHRRRNITGEVVLPRRSLDEQTPSCGGPADQTLLPIPIRWTTTHQGTP